MIDVADVVTGADPDRHVYSVGQWLHLPREILLSLGISKVGSVLIEPEIPGRFFLSHPWQLQLWKLRLSRRVFWLGYVRQNQSGEWGAEIPKSCAAEFRDKCFHVVNYHPRYYLMPTDLPNLTHDEGQDRARFWAGISSYHEHLPLTEQDLSANQISEWFAREVIAPLRPSSILEIGCGSGRNLIHIQLQLPNVALTGVDVNPGAVAIARKLTTADIRVLSIYDLSSLGNFDLIFSMGVLMHIPHTRIFQVIQLLHEKSIMATAHFELHGDSHSFDYHRYPRDYQAIYKQLSNSGTIQYQVFARGDFRNAGESVGTMALLVNRKSQDSRISP